MKSMLAHIFSAVLAMSFTFSTTVVSAATINVGGIPFPPFVEKKNGQYSGITIELIEAMNKFQDKHTFKLVGTSPQRRYESFNKGEIDLIMFEDKSWGWQEIAVTPSIVYLSGGEVYITQSDGSKDQSYFDNLENRSIAIINGYHYGFADFNSDPTYLNENFDVQLSSSFDGNVLKVHAGRADVAVVTLSYLKKMLVEKPELNQSLLVSDKFDQKYQHTMLLRDSGIDFTIADLNQLISDMNTAGILDKIWAKYGVLELKTLS